MSASHKEISNILAAIGAASGGTTAMALATVVEVEGSAYRRTGARMLIQHDGHWVGSISGGCLEGNALRIARQVMRDGQPQLITYDTRSDDNARILGASLGCNGIIQVWIEPLQGEYVVAALEELKRAFVGESERWYGRMLEGVAEEIGRLFPLGQPATTTDILPNGAAAQFVAASGLQTVVFAGKACLFAVERVVPAIRLLVFGGGEDARPLCQVAEQMGWRVTVTDDCAAKTLPVRFPEAERVVHLERTGAVQALRPDCFSAAVLLSHNYGYDKAILEGLLATEVAYIGILGPRKRFERLVDELGTDLAQHDGVHAPIGLDIGAQTPFEIAIAIVAEIQAKFTQREGGFLRLRVGSIHHRKPALA